PEPSRTSPAYRLRWSIGTALAAAPPTTPDLCFERETGGSRRSPQRASCPIPSGRPVVATSLVLHSCGGPPRSVLEQGRERSLIRLTQLGQRNGELLLDVQGRFPGAIVDDADPLVREPTSGTHVGEPHLLRARHGDDRAGRRLGEQEHERVDLVGHPHPSAHPVPQARPPQAPPAP